jgi:hypothetical protein
MCFSLLLVFRMFSPVKGKIESNTRMLCNVLPPSKINKNPHPVSI